MLGAGILALFVINSITAPGYSMQGDYVAALDYVVTQARVKLGVLLAGFAFLGALMRAAAHKRHGVEPRDAMDLSGKLFAVAAASLALWIAILAVPDLSDALARTGIIAVGALLIFGGIGLGRWGRQHAKERRNRRSSLRGH